MNDKEAKARIKINKLLEEAGWQDTNGDGVINVLDCIVIGQHWSA